MSNYDYDDDEEDDLQRRLEGRDVEDDYAFDVHKRTVIEAAEKRHQHGSKKSTRPAAHELPEKRKNTDDARAQAKKVAHKASEVTPDDDMDDFIENDMDEDEEDDNAPVREDEAEEAPEPERRVIKARRVVMNPRPKLDANKLKTDRGLVALMEAQKSLQLKGKGHEKRDLDSIMFTLEHWAHRLFPGLNFDDFLEKTENLGKKKLISTYLKKMRLGLSLDKTGEFVEDEVEAQKEDDEFLPEANEDDPTLKLSAEEAFDSLFPAEQNERKSRRQRIESDSESDDNMEAAKEQPSTTLTLEQRNLIAQNRLKALEKRKALMAAMPTEATEPVPEPTNDVEMPDAENDDEDEELSEDEIIKQLNSGIFSRADDELPLDRDEMDTVAPDDASQEAVEAL